MGIRGTTTRARLNTGCSPGNDLACFELLRQTKMRLAGIVCLAFLFGFCLETSAQTSLSLSDIAFTGYRADDNDQFTIVLLTDVDAGTQIQITDRAWDVSGGGFVSEGTHGEGTLTFTFSNAYSCGDELYFSESGGTWTGEESDESTSAGTVNESGTFTLGTNGDQIFIYQGAEPTTADESPFVTAIQMNGSGWNTATNNESQSEQPAIFSSGNNSVVFTSETDGAEFDCGASSSAAAVVINDETNWTSDDSNINLDPYCTFTCPSGLLFCDDCNSTTGVCALPDIADNPSVTSSCDELQIVFIIDESGSIGGFEQDVEDGVMAFVSELDGTGAEIALIEFAPTATVVSDYVEVTPAVVAEYQDYFDGTGGGYNGETYAPNSGTNWQSAMEAAYSLDTADVVFFFTDGNPTGYTTGAGVNDYCSSGGSTQQPEIVNPMIVANAVKDNWGAHMFMVGVGNVTSTNLERMSGTEQWVSGTNTVSDADYALGNFDELAQDLQQFAQEICVALVDVEVTPIQSDACVGDVITWSITIENVDPENVAQDVILRDTLPASFTNITCTTNCTGFCVGTGCDPDEPANVIVWNAGDIPVGDSITIEFEATVTQAGSFFNEAWAESEVVDPTSGGGTVNVFANPVADAGADQSICAGDPASLSASASGGAGPYAYEWSTGATTQNILVNPSSNTTYTVTVTDDNGCTDEASVTVSIDLSPTVAISADVTDICDGGTANLTANPAGGQSPYTYSWSNSATTQGISVSPGATQGYSVTVTDANGCTNEASITVNVFSDPTVSIAADDNSICEGGSVLLTSTVSGGTGTTTYQWQINNSGWSNIPGATSDSYTTPALVAGLHQYRLVVTQSSGCSATSADQTISVATDPTVSVVVDDFTICDGGTATLTATVSGGNGPTSYQWQINNSGWSDISGATSNIFTTPTLSPGSFEYRVVITQDEGCDAISVPNTIIVSPDATVSVSADNQVVCIGGSVLLDATVTGGTGSFDYQWQSSPDGSAPWTNIAGANSSQYSPPTSSSGTTFYRIVISDLSSGCTNPASAGISVDVVDDPVASVSVSSSSLCVGGSALFTASVTGGTGTTTYQWQFNNSGTWQNVGGATSDTYSALLLNPGTFEYRVIVNQAAGCADTSAASSVTVVADPTVSIAVDNGTICEGGQINLTSTVTGGTGTTTYQWEFNNGGTWEDISGATSEDYSVILNTADTYEYRLSIQQSPGCEATSSSVTVTVVADPTVTVSVDEPAICEGGNAEFTATVTGGSGANSYQWQFNNSGTWQNIGGATASTYSAALLNPGTFEYRVIVTQTTGCSTTSAPVSVTVTSDPTVTVGVSDQQICDGGAVTLTASVSGGSGSSTFQWQQNPGSGWQDIPGEVNAIFNSPALATGTYNYRVVVNQDEGCTAVSDQSTITVLDDPVATISGSATDLCNGGVVSLTSSVTGGTGTTTYQWQINPGPGFSDIAGATSSTYASAPLTPGTYSYRLIVNQDAGCTDTSNVFTATVVPDPTVSVSVDDQTICDGGSAELVATVSGGTGTTLYQWQINNSGWQDIGGANGSTFNTPSLSTGTYQYRVVVTQGDGCDVTSSTITITAVADPVASISVDFSTICEGGDAIFTASVTGGTGVTSLQWEFNHPTNGWEDVPGETGAIFTAAGLGVGSYEYRVRANQDSGCEDISNEITVTVVPDPTVSISADNANLCAGNAATLSSTVTGGTGGISYQWQYDDPVNNWVDIVGAVNASYTTAALGVGVYDYRLVVTQNSGCLTISTPVTVTVVAAPTVSINVDDSSICEEGTALFTSTVAGGVGGTTYQWQIDNSGTWNDIAGATSDTYSAILLNAGTYTYRLVISQGGGCDVTSSSVSVTVVPDPVVSVNVADQNICEGGTAQFDASVVGGSGTATYQWQFNNSGTWEDVSGATSSTYDVVLLNAGTYEYRVVVNQDSGCETISAGATVTVVADPTVNISANDIDICEGGLAQLTSSVSGGSGANNYQWQTFTSGSWGDISGATSAGYSVALFAPGTYEYRLVVTQDAGCETTSDAVTITVVNDPVATISAVQTDLCDGGVADLSSVVTGGNGTTNYQWQINSSGWQDILGATSDTYTSSTLAVGTYEYRLVITQDEGCDAISNTITITVDPDPTVSVNVSDNTICDGGSVTLTATVGGGSGTSSFQWQINNSGSWDDISGETSNIFTAGPLATGTYQYRVQVTQNEGCAVTSAASTITVVADPTVSVSADNLNICVGGVASLSTVVSGGTGTTSYQWQYDDPVDGWEDISGETGASYVTPVLGVGTFDYRVVITQDAGCEVTSTPITINVVPDPVVSLAADDQSICDGGSVELTATVTGGTGTTVYQWQYNDPVDGWEDISGANTSVYNTPGLAIGTHDYRVVIDQSTGCNVISDPVTITVVAGPVASIAATQTSVCEGGTADLTSTVSGGSGTTTLSVAIF